MLAAYPQSMMQTARFVLKDLRLGLRTVVVNAPSV